MPKDTQKVTQKTPQQHFKLALRHERGVGVVKDMKEAVRYYKRAADKGHDSAQFNLGRYYSKGVGVAKNEMEAARYFKLAADQGHSKAQFNIAACYAKGVAVVKNMDDLGKDKAKDWVKEKVKSQMSGLAKDSDVKNNKVKEEPKVKNFEKTLEQFNSKGQKHVKKGFAASLINGLEKDLKKAARYYKLAADQGHDKAQFTLGRYYEDGNGVKKNLTDAFKYYKLAADQGHEKAQFNLGRCYENGIGAEKDQSPKDLGPKDLGPKDLEQAVKYYKLAADQGHDSAKDALKRIA